MKKLLALTLLLIAFSSRAQYFQHLYGTSVDDSLTSGINTNVVNQGYFMAADNVYNCIVNIPAITASRTDINGTSFFNNEYVLTTNAGGLILARDPQVFEWDNGQGFGIIGRYEEPGLPAPNTGVFYIQLDTSGNPVNTFRYPAVTSSLGKTYEVTEVAAVRKAIYTPDTIYVTGTSQNSDGENHHFVIKIDMYTGGLGWGWVYNLLHPIGPNYRESRGKDLLENPWFPNWFPMRDLIVVGWTRDNVLSPNRMWDGFLFHTDAATGIVTPAGPIVHPTFIYGRPDSVDFINAITAATDTNFNPPGFVLGGGTWRNGNFDFYNPRTDFLGNPLWLSSFDYSWNIGTDNVCYDVIERIDSSGNWTYLAAGTADAGFFGGKDVQVVKMDNFGNPIANGEFTFGGNGNDYGKALDMYNNNGALPPDGLSTFGTWNSGSGIGGQDMYLVRSYFDGNSGCNDTFNTPVWNPTFPGHPPIIPDTLTHFDTSSCITLSVATSDASLCFSSTIPGGSNAFVAPPKKGDDRLNLKNRSLLLIPNPTENGNSNQVSLKVESDKATEADVAIYDMQGRQYFKGRYKLVQGINQLPIDLAELKMASGMYSVVISDNEKTMSTMMMVK